MARTVCARPSVCPLPSPRRPSLSLFCLLSPPPHYSPFTPSLPSPRPSPLHPPRSVVSPTLSRLLGRPEPAAPLPALLHPMLTLSLLSPRPAQPATRLTWSRLLDWLSPSSDSSCAVSAEASTPVRSATAPPISGFPSDVYNTRGTDVTLTPRWRQVSRQNKTRSSADCAKSL